MRSRLVVLSAASVCFIAAASALLWGEQPAKDGAGLSLMTCEQAALERLKGLAGTWVGSAWHDSTDGSTSAEIPDVKFEYSITAGGNVVMERLFAGMPHEMVTMYHLDGTDLVLTHYCAAGNQPTMKATEMNLAADEAATLSFECIRLGNAESEDAGHMHMGKIVIIDADHIKGEWTGYKDGKPEGTARFDLHRKKDVAGQ